MILFGEAEEFLIGADIEREAMKILDIDPEERPEERELFESWWPSDWYEKVGREGDRNTRPSPWAAVDILRAISKGEIKL